MGQLSRSGAGECRVACWGCSSPCGAPFLHEGRAQMVSPYAGMYLPNPADALLPRVTSCRFLSSIPSISMLATCSLDFGYRGSSCAAQSVHAPLLQRSVRTHDNPDVHSDVSLLPVAMREAAFLESADCYTAMIAKPEVRPVWFGYLDANFSKTILMQNPVRHPIPKIVMHVM